MHILQDLGQCGISIAPMLSAEAVITYALVGQENFDEDMSTNEYERTYNRCA